MPTVTIGDNTGDDYSGVVDDRIDSASNDNNGAHTRGYCGVTDGRIMKELQRWNLSVISSGVACNSAILYLFDTDWYRRMSDCAISVYAISNANGSWIEGTEIDNPQAGSPCWSYRQYNTTPWAGSEGLSTAGTDYINTVIASATFADGVTGYKAITFNADGRTYLEDIFGAADNNGIIITGAGTDSWTEFVSHQGTDGQRPYLSVTYGSSPLRSSRLKAFNKNLVRYN